jgi:hypothetical protein
MKNEKRHFVVVLPSSTRIYKDLDLPDRLGIFSESDSLRTMARDVVAAAKLTTPRKNPKYVTVGIFEQTIKNGVIVEISKGSFDVMPPLERMTSIDYVNEWNEIILDFPFEFNDFVVEQLDRGCSYEEKIEIARDIVSGLRMAISKYDKKLYQSFVNEIKAANPDIKIYC